MHRAFLIMGIIALSGCVSMNAASDFTCDAQLGQPCTTIQDADGGTGVGATRTLAEAPQDTQSRALTQDQIAIPKAGGTTVAALAPDGGAPYHVQRYRIPERLGTVWFAPRLDGDGIFHEAHFAHFVIREAGWGNRAPAGQGSAR